MPMVEIYPMTFEPVFRDYIWGGRNLEALYGRALPEGIVAESWDISAYPGAVTRIENGYWKWRTLGDVTADLGGHFLGSVVRERFGIRFPLLVKLLDAQRDLSVQVHPDDRYAAAHENGSLGKSEMWYVLHAEPGAELILGLAAGATRAAFEQAVQAGQIEPQLNRIPVRAGDVLDIPAGTVHALLAGVIVAEIQQNSDATYRIYDWGRLRADGQPRPLHIERALDVIDWEHQPGALVAPQLIAEANGMKRELLVDAPAFTVERIALEPGTVYEGECDGNSFQIIGCVAGNGLLKWSGAPLALRAVRFTLLPAILGRYSLQGESASVWLRTYIH